MLPGDDEVVEHAHVHEGEGLLQGVGEIDVGARGFGHAAGVVVRQHHRRGVVVQRAQHDLARVDAQGTLKNRDLQSFLPFRCVLRAN